MKSNKIRKTPGASEEDREQYWIRVIERARNYPGGVTEFCRVFKIRKNNYYQWFKRLKLKHPEWEKRLPAPKYKKSSGASFVPVIVKVNPEVIPPAAVPREEERIEIRLLEGHSILIPNAVDKQALQVVLEVLNKKK